MLKLLTLRHITLHTAPYIITIHRCITVIRIVQDITEQYRFHRRCMDINLNLFQTLSLKQKAFFYMSRSG